MSKRPPSSGSDTDTNPTIGGVRGGGDGGTADGGHGGVYAADALLRIGRFFRRHSTVSADLRRVERTGGRSGEREPRGRADPASGAAPSWFPGSPTRVRFPYARGVLVAQYREARGRLGDPVAAWADIVGDPVRRRRYQQARGKGGLTRITWDEAVEMIAAAHVHTIRTYGPDRIAGFSPVPARSMVSHTIGARFIELLGGVMTSGGDRYADLPVASAQIFGDQTDVPPPSDWPNATYLLRWGANSPVTRTPDAHRLAEARYRGQKVVAIGPDFGDNTTFADEWLPALPGTDGALAMAMGHVILREFLVDNQVPFFADYLRRFTDMPFLVTLTEAPAGGYLPAKFLTAADLTASRRPAEGEEWKTALIDSRTGDLIVPNGSLGFRYTETGMGRWNLDLDGVVPQLTFYGDPRGVGTADLLLPRFDSPDGSGDVLRRSVPVRRIGGRLVTTVFDLVLAQYGLGRLGLPGDWPEGYDDAARPYTPAWQEPLTSVPARHCVRIAREMAANAERSGGKNMIITGAGIGQWFHGDVTYRAILALLLFTGSIGRTGGGWAPDAGPVRCRPVTGWTTLAMGLDWSRPPRQMIGTAFWYTHADQWRYDGYRPDVLTSPLARGQLAGMHTIDTVAQSARLGWMPSYPQFDRNPLDLADEIAAAGERPDAHVVRAIGAGTLRFAAEDPDAPENWPRVLTLWRANLRGSSLEGNEYFLRHLLGTHSALRATETPPDRRPRDVVWRDHAPEGKLDLLVSLDFRMTSSTLLSDIVLPAATRTEKYDLSSADTQPFVQACTPATEPPWESRSDFAAFTAIARRFSELAIYHLGVRHDLVATPLQHDSPGETAQPGGVARDWRADGSYPVPGQTMPSLTIVERDYPAVADKLASLGPLVEQLGLTTMAITVVPTVEVAELAGANGIVTSGAGAGRPSLDTDAKLAETILALSGATNGRIAVEGFHRLAERTGQSLMDLTVEVEGRRITFADTRVGPVPVLTSAEWSGSGTGEARYAPFTLNVERLTPWHTLTGRMHFFLDHDWMHEFGESLPIYRPPLDMQRLFGEPALSTAPPAPPGPAGPAGPDNARRVTVRYLTPHSTWSIHSEHQDDLLSLSLARGGPTVWISEVDAAAIGVRDNEWVEAVNRNGVLVARAIVTHRLPGGMALGYHVQERLVNVPISETSGRRGGVHNSLTRVLVKPNQLIGGYAQLAYAVNYLGPAGNHGDEVTVIRRRGQKVRY